MGLHRLLLLLLARSTHLLFIFLLVFSYFGGGIQDSELPGGSGKSGVHRHLHRHLLTLDMHMSQYIHDNTEAEFTLFNFINEYPKSRGARPSTLTDFVR